jgi:hypothetical protein
MDGGTRGSLVTRFCSSHRCGAVIRFLSADFRESPDSDSGAVRSSHVHDVTLVDTCTVTFRDIRKF